MPQIKRENTVWTELHSNSTLRTAGIFRAARFAASDRFASWKGTAKKNFARFLCGRMFCRTI
ncbi:MAG: hypothetical protein LBH19_10415 [Dysgonamonadaceae bacterium]|nr:hypothetical protein [Dysgonamonadaceae bacterium]